MLFNSIDFAFFLPITFLLYWFIFSKSTKARNLFLAIISYVFYGWWDWRFLILIFFSSGVDFLVGLKLEKVQNKPKRKALLLTSILLNLGFLGFFKYYNFFLDNFIDAFKFFGFSFGITPLNIILPVGISFYTFQTLSYTIDVYKKKLNPTSNFVSFIAFVSFFPQLVAGPIERASNLLPQFKELKKFDRLEMSEGLRQILWGLFKKIVIADNCAVFVNQIFHNSTDYSGSTLFFGGVLFAFQIYGDFSGYSDIAIGTARLFGFKLMKNFAFPYFSRDIAEFWRRWHISLSTWFRDYLYIPLGGSRVSKRKVILNTFIIFLVSGFWHGANWTFIVWGGLHALYFLPLLLRNKNRRHIEVVAAYKNWPTYLEMLQMGFTFLITTIAWIFFRANNLNHAYIILKKIFSPSLFTIPDFAGRLDAFWVLVIIGLFMLIEWAYRNRDYAFQNFQNQLNRKSRLVTYYFIVLAIMIFGQFSMNEFIYFQF